VRTVSLYSGAGGLDIGFIQAGFDVMWANDIDPDAVATYRANLGNHIFQGDLTQQMLPAATDVEAVIGGPPCQGFSVAGKMDPSDPRSRHVWNFLAVVRSLKPTVFVMENVKNLATNRRWSGLRESLIEAAERLGYQTEMFLLNSADFGVPQTRERMFLVGIRGLRPLPPAPISKQSPVPVRDVLLSLPAAGSPGNSGVCKARITLAKNPVLRRSPYAGMLFNGQGRPLDLGKPAPTLPASMGGNRTPIIDERLVHHYSEQSWIIDYHAGLMKGGAPGGSVPPYLRRLTVQEAAAIQSFPRGHVFSGAQSAQYRQIGNAVPPALGYHLAKALATQLGGQREPSAAA
jgi:DNA (cytosine-5)-methyltransferase 1